MKTKETEGKTGRRREIRNKLGREIRRDTRGKRQEMYKAGIYTQR